MRGNVAKPLDLKLLQGTAQPCRTKGKGFKPRGKARCPKWISPRARQFWKYLEPTVVEHGLLSDTDWGAFGDYCQAMATAAECQEILNREGLILETKNGPTAHPAFKIQKDCWVTANKLAEQFGLTPASRSRVSNHEPEQTNLFQEFLKNG